MINCAVIDDEPMAIELMVDYIGRVEFLNLTGTYRDAVKALDKLQAVPVDLVFLDINMPDLTGTQFLKAIPQPPLVVFTTAYSRYAIESYEFEAVDYLLKPIQFPRFLTAVHRARERFLQQRAYNGKAEESEIIIPVKSGTEIHRLKSNEILYVEGAGNYVQFVTSDKVILSLMKMTEVTELLGETAFIRIHRSYIVALKHIDVVCREHLLVKGKKIPIGEKYRASISRFI